MTKFEAHLGQTLPVAIMSHLENTSLDALEKQAEDMKFKSWCPVSFENDSQEARNGLRESSELLFNYVAFRKDLQS